MLYRLFITLTLLCSSCVYYYSLDEDPLCQELMSHTYRLKEDLFLLRAEENTVTYWGECNYKYLLEAPGVISRTPKSVDEYLKYGLNWVAEKDKYAKDAALLNPIVDIIPKGTLFNITHIQHKGGSDTSPYYTSFYCNLHIKKYDGARVRLSLLIRVISDTFGNVTFKIDEKYLELVN